jgi:hypothetical protein
MPAGSPTSKAHRLKPVLLGGRLLYTFFGAVSEANFLSEFQIRTEKQFNVLEEIKI